MNTKHQYIEYHYKSAFASHEDPKTLADAALDLTNAAIHGFSFLLSKETKAFHRLVKNFIFSRSDHYLGYLEYCERILLLAEDPLKYGEPPLFNRFNNTKADHDCLLRIRKHDPEYKKNWKGLAEAILEMQETPSPYIMVYWENWFRERNAAVELTLFRKAIGKSIHSV